MNTQALMDTAKAMIADDKGLLAIDESHPTCNKRFAKHGIPQSREIFSSSSTASACCWRA